MRSAVQSVARPSFSRSKSPVHQTVRRSSQTGSRESSGNPGYSATMASDPVFSMFPEPSNLTDNECHENTDMDRFVQKQYPMLYAKLNAQHQPQIAAVELCPPNDCRLCKLDNRTTDAIKVLKRQIVFGVAWTRVHGRRGQHPSRPHRIVGGKCDRGIAKYVDRPHRSLVRVGEPRLAAHHESCHNAYRPNVRGAGPRRSQDSQRRHQTVYRAHVYMSDITEAQAGRVKRQSVASFVVRKVCGITTYYNNLLVGVLTAVRSICMLT